MKIVYTFKAHVMALYDSPREPVAVPTSTSSIASVYIYVFKYRHPCSPYLSLLYLYVYNLHSVCTTFSLSEFFMK